MAHLLKMLSDTLKRQGSSSSSSSGIRTVSGPMNARAERAAMQIVQSNYTSKPVDIPPDFLKATPPDAETITVERIDFSTSPLPEYATYYATVLDNVLSTTECTELLRLAMESSPKGNWEQAMVNAGIGREVLAPEVRLCGR
jgi:hypothetical protein